MEYCSTNICILLLTWLYKHINIQGTWIFAIRRDMIILIWNIKLPQQKIVNVLPLQGSGLQNFVSVSGPW